MLKQYYPPAEHSDEMLKVKFLDVLSNWHLDFKKEKWGTRTRDRRITPGNEDFGLTEIVEVLSPLNNDDYVLDQFDRAGSADGSLIRLLPTYSIEYWGDGTVFIDNYQKMEAVRENIGKIKAHFESKRDKIKAKFSQCWGGIRRMC